MTTAPILALVGDQHLYGRDGARGEQALRRTLTALAEHPEADRILPILLGDLVDGSLLPWPSRRHVTDHAEQLDRAGQLLADWLIQPHAINSLVITPGNHDVGVPLGAVTVEEDLARCWRRYVGRRCMPWAADQRLTEPPLLYLAAGTLVIVADSTAGQVGVDLTPDLARQELGEDQLKRIASALDYAARLGVRPVVVLHGHPLDRGWGVALEDSRELQEILAPHTSALVVFGHKHEEGSGTFGGGARWFAAAKLSSGHAPRVRLLDLSGGDVAESWLEVPAKGA